MRTIYKYTLNASANSFQLPENARPLTVQVQNGQPQLWVELDPEAPTITRVFAIFGTGHELPEARKYVATFQEPPFVFHVFEVLAG